MLERGAFQVNSISFRNSEGQSSQGDLAHSRIVDPARNAEKLVFPWGNITVEYGVAGDRLIIRVATTNVTSQTLRAFSYDLLALRLPERPPEYDGSIPLLATNIGAPTVVPLSFGRSGSVTLCNDDVKWPLLAGFPWALDKPGNTRFPLRVNTGRDGMYPDSLPDIERPILPGATDRFSLSLRFERASIAPRVAAADVFALFARLHPFTLTWPDRRPIGSLMIGTAAAGWAKNPRGWLLDPHLDVTNAAGVESFERRLLAWADRSIIILKNMNAQGMVTWDVEGEQFPHATTYIGDPRLVGVLAPEMARVVDSYFKRFRDAGLRVGVTIRPQTLAVSADRRSARQQESPDSAHVLIDKIAYARERWKATLFYIDSNGDPALPLSFDVIERVAAKFPDVLLMPEHKNLAYYSKTAPYSELRGGVAATPQAVREVYGRAFSVINVADGHPEQRWAALEEGVGRGDILMFRAWFDDPVNARVRALYRVAAGHASGSRATR